MRKEFGVKVINTQPPSVRFNSCFVFLLPLMFFLLLLFTNFVNINNTSTWRTPMCVPEVLKNILNFKQNRDYTKSHEDAKAHS